MGALSKSRSDSYEYPVITEEEINFLSSLSLEDLRSILDDYIIRLQEEGIVLEERCDDRYEELYNYFEESGGIESLLTFAEEYMISEPGWERIEALIPMYLDDDQEKIYVSTAVYIDNIARPIYDILKDISHSLEDRVTTHDNDKAICIWKLKQDLKIAAIGVSWDVFLDIMSGGSLTLVDVDLIATQAINIFLDYEVCNHRWH